MRGSVRSRRPCQAHSGQRAGSSWLSSRNHLALVSGEAERDTSTSLAAHVRWRRQLLGSSLRAEASLPWSIRARKPERTFRACPVARATRHPMQPPRLWGTAHLLLTERRVAAKQKALPEALARVHASTSVYDTEGTDSPLPVASMQDGSSGDTCVGRQRRHTRPLAPWRACPSTPRTAQAPSLSMAALQSLRDWESRNHSSGWRERSQAPLRRSRQLVMHGRPDPVSRPRLRVDTVREAEPPTWGCTAR
mmetsp:Transcript_34319/g.91739  ORF Transcript_34319/g.91739 Transcript_34319/m.91739 type:complete len:250 (-) Transcript_34319:150-899(-)